MVQPQTSYAQDLDARIRIVESKQTLLRERLEITNQNMIKHHKKNLKELKIINSELAEIKNNITEIKDTLNRIIKEMEFFARKEKLAVLEKYINLINPMEFVTTTELKQAIKAEKRGAK